MINLIPNQEKKRMLKDFHFRLIVLVLVMLSITTIIGSVALLPAYFFSISEKNIAKQKLETEKLKPLPTFDEKTSSMITDLNAKIELIEKIEGEKFIFSEKVINAIILERTPGIKINEITYENAAKGKTIGVTGTAPSREALLSFRESLEKSDYFKKVDLPISNFIKGSNIEFYLNLIPA